MLPKSLFSVYYIIRLRYKDLIDSSYIPKVACNVAKCIGTYITSPMLQQVRREVYVFPGLKIVNKRRRVEESLKSGARG